MISFKATPEDFSLISQIVRRARNLYPFDQCTLAMDLIATHVNGCPLRLNALLNAPDLDFAHDVAGISRHIDRETGKLTDFFVPRYADVSAL